MRTTSALDESASMAAPRTSAARAEVTCTPIFYRAAIVQDVDGSSRLPDEEAAKRPPASSNDQAELPLAATPKMPGRTPGVMALDIIDNVVPYIPKEEEKRSEERRVGKEGKCYWLQE